MSSEKVKFRPFELLLDQQRIERRVKELADLINTDYAGREPILIGVLKGCFVFMADLLRNLKIPVEVDFISAASYHKGCQPSEVTLGDDVGISIKGRDILIVEGIIDTGRTVTKVMERLNQCNPASVELVTLLDKPNSHRSELSVKYRGFTIGNEFVIGYGLDNTQKYRNLPYIGRMIDG